MFYNYLSKPAYEAELAKTRDARMKWWREARFGMFVHFGLFSVMGHHEWGMVQENVPIPEYEKLANQFNPKPGAPREWAKLAKQAGMKYMVMTTRHHEGFCLWDSKANPYNSVNYGPHRDIVREFVDACREFDLKIGFYSTLMEWHHPDSWKCAYDTEARKRYTDYIKAINTELLSNYGKIDILWYDVPAPMQSWEGWDSLERNQWLRQLQPDIIINDRSKLDEDFGTPEESIRPDSRDWEACMTFNGLSWGYVDSEQVAPYSYNSQRILRMLNTCAENGGNLLLNIGPKPDGSVPDEAVKPLQEVGAWLAENGECAYGAIRKNCRTWERVDSFDAFGGNGISGASAKGNKVYLWNWIWPVSGEMGIGGYMSKLRAARILKDGTPIEFEQKGQRIILKNMGSKPTDTNCGVSVIELEFEEQPKWVFASYYPQLSGGMDYSGGNRI